MKYIYLTILLIFCTGCGFKGEAIRLGDDTIKWNANRPCVIKDNKQEFELDGKGEPLLNFDIPLNKIGD